MNIVRRTLQHLLNPLHLYCRLKDAGFADRLARRLCRVYECALYRRLRT